MFAHMTTCMSNYINWKNWPCISHCTLKETPPPQKSHFNHLTFTLFKWKYHMHAVEKNRIPVWKRNICDLHVIFYQLTSFRFLITSRRYNSLWGWACSTCQKFENVYDIYIRPYTFWSEKLSWAKNISGCLLQNLHYYYLIHYR